MSEALRILSIFGTRPEAIKMAPVVHEMERYTEKIASTVVVTAQHRQMLDQVLSLFQITPDEDLNIMQHDQTLFDITSRSLSGIQGVLEKHRPHLVLVQGDTTTVFAASLAAFYHKIPVGHVEAGLRTHDRYQPFPEEMNRRLTTCLADLHFAPTELARRHLLESAVPERQIFLTGNTVTDALQSMTGRIREASHPVLERIPPSHRILLVEAHRRENLGKPMEEICKALLHIVKEFQDASLIFPVHKNPRVRETVFGLLSRKERIHLMEPVDYLTLLRFQQVSYLILTDSGGIQEEAPSFGKPVLVLRRTTERPEGVEAGVAKVVGTDRKKIVEETARLLDDRRQYRKMASIANPYGDGKAAGRIVQAILYWSGLRESPPRPFKPGAGS